MTEPSPRLYCRQSRLRQPSMVSPPLAQGRSVGTGAGLADHGDQLGQHFLDVADDGHVHLHALGDGGGIDVDMDDLALHRHEMLGVADHPVVKARTHGQQHIAVLHGVVGFDGAVHAQHAEELAVAGRIGTQAQQRMRDRVAQHVDQGAQLVAGIAQQHAATRRYRDAWQPAATAAPCGSGRHGPCAPGCRSASPPFGVTGVERALKDTSLGMSTTTGPGRPVRAMWKAFFMVSASSRTSLTRKLCLTMGRVMPTVSHSWNASVPM